MKTWQFIRIELQVLNRIESIIARDIQAGVGANMRFQQIMEEINAEEEEELQQDENSEEEEGVW